MNDRDPSMLKAALIGGAAFGLIGGLPYLELFNCACCALVIAGGFSAAWLYSRDSVAAGVEFSGGKGALVGLIAGLFYTVGSTFSTVLFNRPSVEELEAGLGQFEQFDIPPETLETIETLMAQPVWLIVIGACFTLLSAAVFSTIGGLIGGAVFKFEPKPPAAPGVPTPPVPPAPPTPETPTDRVDPGASSGEPEASAVDREAESSPPPASRRPGRRVRRRTG